MKNINKYVKALSAIWLIISFIISSSIVADSSTSGIRSIFLFFGCMAVFSFPVWLYFIGFYLWGDGYIKKTLIKVAYSPLKIVNFLSKISYYQEEKAKLSGNFFINLFRGNVRLVITYWLFFKGGDLVNSSILNFYEFSSEITYCLFLAFAIFYFFFSVVSTWRSANKYEGEERWKNIAKVIVIISVIAFISSAIKELNYTQEERIVQAITDMNKNLPQMVDDITRLDFVKLEGAKAVVYSYSLISNESVNLENLNEERLLNSLKPSLVKNLCSNSELRKISETRNVIYEYKKGQNFLVRIPISYKDCN